MLDSILPPTNGTDTSAMAQYVVAGKAASDRALAYKAVREALLTGMSCSEFMYQSRMEHASASARFWELSGGNDPDRYPILIAYMGERRPALDEHGNAKRTKSRVYVALCNLSDSEALLVRGDERQRILSKKVYSPSA